MEDRIEKYLGFGINSTKGKLHNIVNKMTVEEVRASIYDAFFYLRTDEPYPNKNIVRMDIYGFYNILSNRCQELGIMHDVNVTELDKVDVYYKLMGDQ